jgi:hypothetical protein
MAIDINKDFDKQVLRRIANLEEVSRDILSAQTQLASNSQITELLSAISLELETIKINLESLERRVSILENNPELD